MAYLRSRRESFWRGFVWGMVFFVALAFVYRVYLFGYIVRQVFKPKAYYGMVLPSPPS